MRLEDCIKAFSKPELVTGDDRWHCPKCKTRRDAEKSIGIWKLPRILVIHLKRFYFEGCQDTYWCHTVSVFTAFSPNRIGECDSYCSIYCVYGTRRKWYSNCNSTGTETQ